jgi:hypothetical protein
MSTTITPTNRDDAQTLDELAHRMRAAVVNATEANDRAAKVEWWGAYRAARGEALTALGVGDTDETGPAGDTPSEHWAFPPRAENPAA